MNDEKSKPSLPLRSQPSHPVELNAESAILADIPHLPGLEEAERPHILAVDDVSEFLGNMKKAWRRHYAGAFELHTLNPAETDWVDWAVSRLQRGERLDAVYLDWNLPAGYSVLDYLIALRKHPLSRYLPVVVMTTSGFDNDENRRQELLRYAQWLLYRKTGDAEFLYQMITCLSSAQDAALDHMWLDLITQTSEKVNNPPDILQEVSSSTNIAREVIRLVGDFLDQQMKFCLYVIREKVHDEYKILRKSVKDDGHGIPGSLRVGNFPLLNLLEKSTTPIKIDKLTKEHIGDVKLEGKPFLGVSLHYEGRTIGTLTLYRKPWESIFREKDVGFIGHLASQMSHSIGWRRKLARNQKRQKRLQDYAVFRADVADEEDCLMELAKILHEEVNQNDEIRAKTSLRRLDKPSGRINRLHNFGLPQRLGALTLDMQNSSLYARALRERKALRYCDWQDGLNDYPQPGQDIRSSLTVPLLMGNQIFGGVNLEHMDINHYDADDEAFVVLLCALAAGTIQRLRLFRFQRQVTELLNTLLHHEDFDKSRERIFQILQDFTGYALLIYMTPRETGQSWLLEHVVDGEDDGNGRSKVRLLPQEQVAVWQQRFDERWDQTYVGEILTQANLGFGYIEGEKAKQHRNEEDLDASGEKLVVYSEAVIPIVEEGAKPRASITLLFRLDQALNVEQQDLLRDFGGIMGEMLHQLDEEQSLSAQLKDSRAQAELGFLYGQLRHVLNNQLGGVNNQLDLLEAKGASPQHLALVRETLGQVGEHLRSMRYLLRKPEFQPVNLETLWHETLGNFSGAAAHHVEAEPGTLQVVFVNSDPKLLQAIFYNLVLNGSQACERAGVACRMRLDSEYVGGQIRLLVSDNGPGVTPTIGVRLFERGTTNRAEGTGFGLHFCHILAERLGGALYWDAGHAPGTRFGLILPGNPI